MLMFPCILDYTTLKQYIFIYSYSRSTADKLSLLPFNEKWGEEGRWGHPLLDNLSLLQTG